jgi:hypothetical protein
MRIQIQLDAQEVARALDAYAALPSGISIRELENPTFTWSIDGVETTDRAYLKIYTQEDK